MPYRTSVDVMKVEHQILIDSANVVGERLYEHGSGDTEDGQVLKKRSNKYTWYLWRKGQRRSRPFVRPEDVRKTSRISDWSYSASVN